MSIPARYDWNRPLPCSTSGYIRISIPARYDWNLPPRRSPRAASSFQFQQGTIGTSHKWTTCKGNRYFNSSKVRLEPVSWGTSPPNTSFQFQQGTIGTADTPSAQLRLAHFNSSKVRLELAITKANKAAHNKFQFQQGTIGTIPNSQPRNLLAIFQFQQGTIGTPLIVHRRHHGHISIPARYDWNLQIAQWTINLICYFNSSKVRLEPELSRFQTKRLLLFQFQQGTIGTVQVAA